MAEKLVNGTGLGEFASKIKESVPLLGNSSAGTVPLVGTDMIADGAVTTDKITNGAVTSGKLDSTMYSRIMKKYVVSIPAGKTSFTLTITPDGVQYARGVLLISYVSNGMSQWGTYLVVYNTSPNSFSTPIITTLAGGTGITTTNVSNGVQFTPSTTGSVPYGSVTIDYLTGNESIFGIATA